MDARMITTLIAIAIAWPRETWEQHECAVFRTRVIHQAQLFGFNGKATTERKRQMEFYSRSVFGRWVLLRDEAVSDFPQWERHGSGVRFCYVDEGWDEDGERTSRWVRIQAKQLIEITEVEYRRPE